MTDLLTLVLVEGGEEEAPADGLLDVLQLGLCLRNYFLHTRHLLRRCKAVLAGHTHRHGWSPTAYALHSAVRNLLALSVLRLV